MQYAVFQPYAEMESCMLDEQAAKELLKIKARLIKKFINS